jgi:hypothetical protein
MAKVVAKAIAVAAVIVGFSAVPNIIGMAKATPVVDQSFIPPGTAAFTVPISNQFASFIDGAQTFTVGLDGTLASVELFIGFDTTQNGAIVDVRPTVGGVPVENDALALASVFLPSSAIPQFPEFASIDFSAFNVALHTGDVLALVIRGAIRGVDDGEFSWQGDEGDPYLAGAGFARTNAQLWTPSCGFGDCSISANRADLGFKILVEPQPAAVPEPTTLSVLGAGIIGLLALRSGRKRESTITVD